MTACWPRIPSKPSTARWRRAANAPRAFVLPIHASTRCGTPSSCSGNSQKAFAHLRHHLAALSGRDPDAISQGAITYQLRRLRLHGLIERRPNSFRYRVTEFGFRAALFFTRLYNRLLRPGLPAALPTLRAVDGPLKRAFDTVNAQINVSIKQAQLAA